MSTLTEPWTLDTLKMTLQDVSEKTGLKGAKLMSPLRYALTGSKSGPGITSLMELLGKRETLERLKAAI